jgi:hypothetical protein
MYISRLFKVAALVCGCIVPGSAALASVADTGPASAAPTAAAHEPGTPIASLPEAPLPDPGLVQSSSSSSSQSDSAQKPPHAGDPIDPKTDPRKLAPGTALPEPNLEGHQTKRILGIVPNFRSVSANQKLPPQGVREKFVSTFEDSFDYSSITFSAVLAGVAQAENSYPQFRQGAAGYGRYFWHTYADQTNENLWVEAIVPSLLRQDTRYYTLGSGGVLKRSAYSFTRVLITRGDDQSRQPNYSEIMGAGIGSSISSLYYPSVDRTWTKIGQRWLTNVIIDGGVLTFKEFWPDINNHVFHQKD